MGVGLALAAPARPMFIQPPVNLGLVPSGASISLGGRRGERAARVVDDLAGTLGRYAHLAGDGGDANQDKHRANRKHLAMPLVSHKRGR